MGPPFPRRPRRFLGLVVLLTVLAGLLGPGAVGAAPTTPKFGPIIEGYAKYKPQTACKPKPKPGVVAFRDLVLATYPGTRDFGISRDCGTGGTSEHKEGRAWDWGVNANVKAERQTARDLLTWLRVKDEHGNRHAMIRRLGIMYIIWNRRIWGVWSKSWAVYCEQKKVHCRDPRTGAIRHPHTDHVHFSFNWPGARKKTSFWNPELSFP